MEPEPFLLLLLLPAVGAGLCFGGCLLSLPDGKGLGMDSEPGGGDWYPAGRYGYSVCLGQADDPDGPWCSSPEPCGPGQECDPPCCGQLDGGPRGAWCDGHGRSLGCAPIFCTGDGTDPLPDHSNTSSLLMGAAGLLFFGVGLTLGTARDTENCFPPLG